MENIYIHFDKPYYAAGDTIYFKTYVTLNELHKPTPLSEVVHVDQITAQNRIIRSILPAGNYRIRVYTRWMLNEGNRSFFNQLIQVGSIGQQSRQADIAAGQSPSNNPDIHFFPEGGELLTGVESKVALKSIGPSVLGIKVK